ncbi:hypothetical protein BDP27DRAFT_1404626 [Rhodocollybia butyracea]|uniref:Uncharacterized protein n=1 Tax=Rhodocollybia butyracea TaxID=206335 RepID=A0A9P5PID4_9AGAR|nr:hypothetical protein BDP27DRAFT_1404626 [Rhodocollybia butyracea]
MLKTSEMKERLAVDIEKICARISSDTKLRNYYFTADLSRAPESAKRLSMLNYDVITLICAEVSGKKDLLHLGLASKHWFLEPALNVLWKKIEDMEPLLSVLPETTLVNGNKMFSRPIAPSSWDRLRVYTSRVREFDDKSEFFSSQRPTVHDSVYAYLGKEKPIFPKLRTLHLNPRLCISNAFTIFLAASLQVVFWPRYGTTTSGLGPSSDLGPSLALLVSKSPGLKSMTLYGYTYSGMSLSVRRLLALESFEARDLSQLEMDLIQALALLPSLTTLSLTFPRGIVLDYTGVESGFPSLTDIELQGSTYDIRKFLAVARPQALEHLYIYFLPAPEHDEFLTSGEPAVDQPLDDVAADIAAITHLLSSFPFLRNLCIETGAFSSLLLLNFAELRLWLLFKPLLELKKLEVLFYDIPLPLSDENTVQIACAWPHLQDLSLSSSADISALESLVFSSDEETASSTAYVMALGLYQIFPNLVEARGPGDGWKQVQKFLDSFQTAKSRMKAPVLILL